MSCFRPPFSGAEPGWEDGCGFSHSTAPAVEPLPPGSTQDGDITIPKNYDRATIVFPTALPLGTDYEIIVSTENLKTGDPDEQIFPTVLKSRDNDGTSEIGFTYLLNAAPTTGVGTNSYTKFKWAITYYL